MAGFLRALYVLLRPFGALLVGLVSVAADGLKAAKDRPEILKALGFLALAALLAALATWGG